MKNTFSILAVVSMAILSAQSFAATSGTLSFTGKLTDNTCSVAINGAGANATIALPSVTVGELDTAGKVSGRTKFTLSLSSCSGTSLAGAAAYFQSGSNVNSNGRLNNTGTATNVDLQILDSSNSDAVINVGNADQLTNTTFVAVRAGSAVALPYSVQYYATGKAGAGDIASSVTYNLIYN